MKTYQIILLIIVLWSLVPHIILWTTTDVEASIKRKASMSFISATWRDLVTLIPNFSAPIVVPIALIFTKWEDNKLPSIFRAWDNDISINGDPRKYDGTNWKGDDVPLDKDNQEVKYGCYWSKGNHPRSFWARYVWLGWRNRASKASEMLGIPWIDTSIITYGDKLTENGHPGWRLMQKQDQFRFYVIKKWGSFAYRLNYGFKIEQKRSSNKTMPVCISFSLKGWS